MSQRRAPDTLRPVFKSLCIRLADEIGGIDLWHRLSKLVPNLLKFGLRQKVGDHRETIPTMRRALRLGSFSTCFLFVYPTQTGKTYLSFQAVD